MILTVVSQGHGSRLARSLPQEVRGKVRAKCWAVTVAYYTWLSVCAYQPRDSHSRF